MKKTEFDDFKVNLSTGSVITQQKRDRQKLQ